MNKFTNLLINKYFSANKFIFKTDTLIKHLPKVISNQDFDYQYVDYEIIGCRHRRGFYYPTKINDVVLKHLNPSLRPIIKVESYEKTTTLTPTDYIPSHMFLKVIDMIGAQKSQQYEMTDVDIEVILNNDEISKIYNDYFKNQKILSIKIISTFDSLTLNNQIWELFKDSYSFPLKKIQKCDHGFYLPDTFCPLAKLLCNYRNQSHHFGKDATLYEHQKTYYVEGFIPPHMMEFFLDKLSDNAIIYQTKQTDWF